MKNTKITRKIAAALAAVMAMTTMATIGASAYTDMQSSGETVTSTGSDINQGNAERFRQQMVRIRERQLERLYNKTITVKISNQNNNPSESLRIIITEKYGITFDSVKIKDLILTVSRISDKKISSNGKRVLQLLLLFEGKAPGAEIKVDDLKEEGFFYGYRSKEIDAAIKRLAAFGLVKQKQDKVKLDFKNCKKVWLEYQEKCKRIIIKSIE